MKLTMLAMCLFLASCSAVWNKEFLVPGPVEGAFRVELHDWEYKLYGGPSFGYVRPQMYGYKLGEVFYFIYPREISSSGMIGPPLIPVGLRIPEAKNPDDALFVLRLFDPSDAYDVAPATMSLFNNAGLQSSCALAKVAQDDVGIEYRCSKNVLFPNDQPTKILVEFDNQHTIELPIRLVEVSGYSPLFSFNGPNPKPQLRIKEDSGSLAYP